MSRDSHGATDSWLALKVDPKTRDTEYWSSRVFGSELVTYDQSVAP
jgi:hypothetical protein